MKTEHNQDTRARAIQIYNEGKGKNPTVTKILHLHPAIPSTPSFQYIIIRLLNSVQIKYQRKGKNTYTHKTEVCKELIATFKLRKTQDLQKVSENMQYIILILPKKITISTTPMLDASPLPPYP